MKWLCKLFIGFYCMSMSVALAADITLTPALEELVVQQGKSVEVAFMLENTSDRLLSYEIFSDVLVAGEGEVGSVQLYRKPFADSPQNWLQKSFDMVVLPPTESVTLPVTLTIPSYATPGLYIYELSFQGVDDGDGAPQGFSAMISLQVQGAKTYAVDVEGVRINTRSFRGYMIPLHRTGALDIEVDVRNTGSMPQLVSGILQVKEGEEVVPEIGYVREFNEKTGVEEQQLGDYQVLSDENVLLMPNELQTFYIPVKLMDMQAPYDWENMYINLSLITEYGDVQEEQVPFALYEKQPSLWKEVEVMVNEIGPLWLRQMFTLFS